jgi:WD40 repeat protein
MARGLVAALALFACSASGMSGGVAPEPTRPATTRSAKGDAGLSGEELLSAASRAKSRGDPAQAQQLFRRARGALEHELGERAVLDPNTGVWGVSALRWSPDGSWLAVAAGSIIHVLDGASFQEKRRFEAASNPVSALAFSGDGRRLAASAGADEASGAVELWDVGPARRISTLVSESGAPDTLVFSPDGALLAGRRWEASNVALWRLSPPGLLRMLELTWDDGETLGLRASAGARRARPELLAFAPDGASLLGVRDDGLLAWDVASGKARAVRAFDPKGLGDPLHSVVFHPRGQFAAAATESGKLLLWEVSTGERVASVDARVADPELAISRDGGRLLAVSIDGSVRSFAVPSLAPIPAQKAASDVVDAIEAAAAHPDARAAAFAGGGGVFVREVSSGALRAAIRSALPITALGVGTGARQLALGTRTGGIVLIDTKSGALRWLDGHVDEVTTLTFSPRSDRLASTSRDKTARLWSVADGASHGVLSHAAPVNGAAYGSDGQTLATAAGDGALSLWDVASGKRLRNLAGSRCALQAVRFSSDGAWLVANASDNSIVRFDTTTYARQPGPRQHDPCSGELSPWTNSLGLSPDGTLIASAPSGHDVDLWSLETGQHRGKLEDQSPDGSGLFHVRSVAFSPRDPLVVAAGGERLLAWRLQSNTGVSLDTGPIAVDMVTFSDDGRFVFGASRRGSVAIWAVNPQSSDLSFALSLVLTSASNALVRTSDGRVEWLGRADAADDAACVVGARVYPAELCVEKSVASGLMPGVLAGTARGDF